MNRPERQSPCLIDGRGVERPVWHFPRTARGVPPDCPLTAPEQAEIERAIGVPWHARTPLPDPLAARLSRLAVVAALALALNFLYAADVGAWELAFWVCLTPAVVGRDLRSVRLACALFGGTVAGRLAWPDPGTGIAELTLGWVLAAGAIAAALLPRSAWMRLVRDSREGDRWPALVRAQMIARNRCPSCAHALSRMSEGRPMWLVCGHCAGLWLSPRRGMEAGAAMRLVVCPHCEYELAGLPLSDELTLRCPECGLAIPIPPDSGGPRLPFDSGVRCWKCKRSLRGLPLVNGDRVQCPDCGQWRSELAEADLAGHPHVAGPAVS